MKRRNFIQTLGAGTIGICISGDLQAEEMHKKKKIKPIEGSWFEFQHYSTVHYLKG